MRKTLAALGVVAFLATGVALANDRLLGETELIRKLNGSPTPIGTCTSSDGGHSFNSCACTASFDAGYGDLLFWTCSEDTFSRNGTCSTTANSNSRPVVARTEVVTLLQSSEMAIAWDQADGGTGMKCWTGHAR